VALAREKKVMSEKELDEILDPRRMTGAGVTEPGVAGPGVPKKGKRQ
jgi:hypothetical protein